MVLITYLLAMSNEHEIKLYRGCYPSLKQYLGPVKANEYCTCVISKLSEKYNDYKMDTIAREDEANQLKEFSFTYEFCAANLDIN